jgi:hypothetical protein
VKRETLILVGVGAGAAALYLYARSRQTRAATLIAQSAGVPVPTPSLLDALLGKVTPAVASFMSSASQLDAKIKSRGAAHYAAWKKAVDRGEKSYAVNRECFVTATGTQTAMAVCMDEGVPGVLE